MRLSPHALVIVVAFALAACSSAPSSLPVPPAAHRAIPYVFQSGQSPTNWIAFPALGPQSSVLALTVGGDGDIWFDGCCSNTISKMTMSGAVTTYTLPSGHQAVELVLGPKSDVWFTELQQYLGRITSDGAITEYRIPIPNEIPTGITVGPDHNLWFSEEQPGDQQQMIGRMRPDGHFFTPFFGVASPSLVTGPDGNVWFTDHQHIGAMSATGQITEYCCLQQNADQIVKGPDGNLWFTETSAAVGKITTTGSITEFPEPSSLGLIGLAVGPDKHIYVSTFANGSPSYVMRVSLSGNTQFFQNPSQFLQGAIVRGPDNNLWFAEQPDIGVFVRFVLSVTPSTINFSSVGQTQPIAVKEQHYFGSWTATSLNPAVATVAPASGNTFTVTAAGSGSTSIDVADAMHNDFEVSVSVP